MTESNPTVLAFIMECCRQGISVKKCAMQLDRMAEYYDLVIQERIKQGNKKQKKISKNRKSQR